MGKRVVGYRRLIYLVMMLLCMGWQAAVAQTPQAADAYTDLGMSTDDLPELRQRGIIRALVSYNQTNYFVGEGGGQYGFEYNLLKQYEKHVNKGVSRQQVSIHIVFVPVPFADLLPALLAGRGDIAAAGLTITRQRAEKVAFSTPHLPSVSEILVSHKDTQPITSLSNLSGKQIYVLRSSSYVQHLRAINKRLQAAGNLPIKIVEADTALQTEDILEMVNAGIIDFTVVDDHLATLWDRVLPDLVLYPKIKINDGGQIAWAIRPNNPELLKSVNVFMKGHKKGSLIGNMYFKQYFRNVKWIKNPVRTEARERLEIIIALLKKYADQYDFDWLMIGAQAYQESKLKQELVSHAGAVGVMQMLPSTASDANVGIPDISQIEPNIHAGVKYMDFLRDRYFSDPVIRPAEQVHFSHAAYNAGPAKVQRMRQLAKKMGYDPNIWFGNVERAALKIVGRETVRYVANIRKYYIAYRLATDKLNIRQKSKAKLKQ